MKLMRLVQLLSILILSLTSQLFAATYIVGTCRAGHQFPTIGAALDAVSAPDDTVLICPGTYYEQVWINKGVNLRGISTSDSSQVVISPPSIGLLGNDVDNGGSFVAAQLRATDATGPVNISDITVDGTSNLVRQSFLEGIYYRNSSGTVNHVTVRNFDSTLVVVADGIWIEGGTSNPSVTVQNSTVHNFRTEGIAAGALHGSVTSPLTATIKNNFVNGSSNISLAFTGIAVTSCETCTTTVADNTVLGVRSGIFVSLGTGSVVANKLINNFYGVLFQGGTYSVTSNEILHSLSSGIQLTSLKAPVIEHNSIVGTPVGIDFNCFVDGNVRSNVFEDVATGLRNVPSGITSTNTYFSAGTIKTGC